MLMIVSFVVHAVASAAEPVERPVRQRIEARMFPSVFQAWNTAENVQDESPLNKKGG
jgi:hypothetical protein